MASVATATKNTRLANTLGSLADCDVSYEIMTLA
jgi:hypothetical protein